jgi:cytochrome c-type biogenesis protein CcmH
MKALLTAFLLSSLLVAAEPDAHERELRRKLVAACCWNETIDQHTSGTADKMRTQLHSLLADGKSDDEILNAFVQEYGKRVLIEPAGSASLLINTVPVVAGVMGLIGVAWLLKRWAARAKSC